MNITFLIGNGFDLGVGLPSRFSDYFPIYCEESKRKEKLFQKFAEEIDVNRAEWSYFERQIGRYTNKFSIETASELIDQLDDFQKGFIRYLKRKEGVLFYDYSDIPEKMISALLEYYSTSNLPLTSHTTIYEKYQRRQSETHTYNFLSFNYTSVLERCLETIPNKTVIEREASNGKHRDKIGKVLHAHGYCDSSPIMGVDGIDQIENKAIAANRRIASLLIKPELNQSARMNYDNEGALLISSSDIICVYGMALGETDRRWWNRILDWLKYSKDRQLVIFLYDKDYSPSSQFARPVRENQIIDILAKYAQISSSEIETMKGRIHLAIHRNIFEMDLSGARRVKDYKRELKAIQLENQVKNGEISKEQAEYMKVWYNLNLESEG